MRCFSEVEKAGQAPPAGFFKKVLCQSKLKEPSNGSKIKKDLVLSSSQTAGTYSSITV